MKELKKRIIAIVGLAGSGKSLVADYIQKHGYEKVYFGGIVIDEVVRRGLEVKEENERQVREELRKKYGMGSMAVLSIEKIEKLLSEGKRVLIDGLYSMSEYKVLRKRFPEMIVISIFTPRSLRYSRLEARNHRPLSNDQARSRDYSEIDNIEKGGPIAIADYTVINDSTVDDLNKKVDEILSMLK